MSRRSALVAVAVALAVGAIACTTVTYAGPRRPESEVALINVLGLNVAKVDGFVVRGDTSKYEVLPGNHILAVFRGLRRLGLVRHMLYRPKEWIRVCVKTKPGRTYLVQGKMEAGRLEVFVTDDATDAPVPPCGPDEDDDDGEEGED